MDRSGGNAIRYDGPDAHRSAMTATRGAVAQAITALAREHGMALNEDASLVEALARLEIGTDIPRELYAVVAEVLAFVYAVDAEATAPA